MKMESQSDYPQLSGLVRDNIAGVTRRRHAAGRMEQRAYIGSVDASLSNSSGSGTGALQFGAVNIGSASKNTIYIVLGVIAAIAIGLFLFFKKK